MMKSMTLDEARAIWDPQLRGSEGYIDAQVRVEAERPLTPCERLAADVIWQDVIGAMERVTDTMTDTSPEAGRG